MGEEAKLTIVEVAKTAEVPEKVPPGEAIKLEPKRLRRKELPHDMPHNVT